MRKSLYFFSFFGLFLLLGSFVFSPKVFAQTETPPIATGTPPPVMTCEDAARYMASGQTELARAAYEAVKALNPQARCAIEGLFRLGTLPPTLLPSPTPVSSFTPLPSSTPSTPNPYDVVEQLAKIKAYDAAATQLAVAVATNPSATEVGEFTGKSWLIWQNAKKGISDYWPWGLAIALAILIFVWIIEMQKLHLDVSDFDISTIDIKLDINQGSDLNKALIAEFEHSIYRLFDATPFLTPDIIDQPLTLPNLPSFTSLPKEAQDLWTFFTKLFPANIVTVKGNLKYEQAKGPGLSIKLIHNRTNDLWGSYTAWQQDLDPDFAPNGTKPTFEEYLALVKPAAIWSYWKVYSRKKSLNTVFGTDNVDSLIATQLASELIEKMRNVQEGKQKTALKSNIEKRYRRALIADPNNLVALLNLGFVSMNGLEFFKRIRKFAQKSDPAFINASYTLGIAEIESYMADSNAMYLKQAEKYLAEALNGAKIANRKNSRLFPDEYILMIRIPFEDVRWWQRDEPSDDPLKDIMDAGFTAPRVLYNLACHLSMAVYLNKLPPNKLNDSLDQALKYLEDVFRIDPTYVVSSESDTSLISLKEKRKKQFAELRKNYKKPAEEPLPIVIVTSLVNLVGEKNAQRLRLAGVNSEHDLLRLASKRLDREALAKKSRVNEEILLHWTRALELIRLSGVDLGMIAVFEAAGVSSLKKLKDWKGEELELLELLKPFKEELKLDIELPQKEVLTWWIEQAEHTPTQIETS